MSTNQQGLVATITTAVLAIILVGGSVAGWLMGKDLPQWLTVADGTIVAGAFASGFFFTQARVSEQHSATLDATLTKYHALAMTTTTAAATAATTAAATTAAATALGAVPVEPAHAAAQSTGGN